MPNDRSRLVYSTDGTGSGRVRESTPPKPGARAAVTSMPDDGIVRVRREKKGRGGKTVTVVTGVPGTDAQREALLVALKQHCGAGGTREGDALVIQGDHRDRVKARLEALGHRVLLAGG